MQRLLFLGRIPQTMQRYIYIKLKLANIELYFMLQLKMLVEYFLKITSDIAIAMERVRYYL